MTLSSKPCRLLLTLPLALCMAGAEARPLDPLPASPSGQSTAARAATNAAGQASNAAGAAPPAEQPDASRPAAPSPLRLDALLSELLARNPEIAARVELREAERARERRAWAFPDPTVQIMGENFRFGSSMAGSSSGTSESPGAVALPPMISYQVSQMFMFPGKRALMAREAALG